MSKSDRLRDLAAGGWLTAVALLVLFLSQATTEPGPPVQGQTQGQQTATHHAVIATPEYERTAAYYQSLCEEDGDVPKSDLCQQWRMANAAASQVRLIADQNNLILAEILALVCTLFFTGWAAIAASKASVAADKAVEVTADTAKRQLRAYVHVLKAGVEWENNQTVAGLLSITNSGQTPAKGLTHWIDGAVGRYGTEPTDTDFPLSKSDLGAGVPMNIKYRVGPMTDEEWIGVRNRTTLLYFWGRVEYEDVFGKRWWTTYCLTLPDDASDDRLSPCPEGNDST